MKKRGGYILILVFIVIGIGLANARTLEINNFNGVCENCTSEKNKISFNGANKSLEYYSQVHNFDERYVFDRIDWGNIGDTNNVNLSIQVRTYNETHPEKIRNGLIGYWYLNNSGLDVAMGRYNLTWQNKKKNGDNNAYGFFDDRNASRLGDYTETSNNYWNITRIVEPGQSKSQKNNTLYQLCNFTLYSRFRLSLNESGGMPYREMSLIERGYEHYRLGLVRGGMTNSASFTVRFRNSPSGTTFSAQTPYVTLDENWHNVWGVYNGTTLCVYLDDGSNYGCTDLSYMKPQCTYRSETRTTGIGGTPDHSNAVFNGYISDVGVWNRSLGINEINNFKPSFWTADMIPSLFNHCVINSTTENCNPNVTVEIFNEFMEELYDKNYNSITLRDYYQYQTNNFTLPARPFIWYFDDARSSTYDLAVPIMNDYDFVATLPVITDVAYYCNDGGCNFNPEQLREVYNFGWDVASHSDSHLNFLTASSNERINSAADSYNWIVENVGIAPVSFVYPYNARNANTDSDISGYFKIAGSGAGYGSGNKDAGFAINIEPNLFSVNRFCMDVKTNPPGYFNRILMGGSKGDDNKNKYYETVFYNYYFTNNRVNRLWALPTNGREDLTNDKYLQFRIQVKRADTTQNFEINKMNITYYEDLPYPYASQETYYYLKEGNLPSKSLIEKRIKENEDVIGNYRIYINNTSYETKQIVNSEEDIFYVKADLSVSNCSIQKVEYISSDEGYAYSPSIFECDESEKKLSVNLEKIEKGENNMVNIFYTDEPVNYTIPPETPNSENLTCSSLQVYGFVDSSKKYVSSYVNSEGVYVIEREDSSIKKMRVNMPVEMDRITLRSPNGTKYCCGVGDDGVLSCVLGEC